MEKEELLKMKREIEPKAKFWNQNSLFLFFGFSSAIFIITAIELFKIIGKDYSFNLNKIIPALINFGNQDYYFIGMIVLFMFGLIVTTASAKAIGNNQDHYNNILNWINRKLNELKNKNK
jgi:hypothetical protein